MKILTYETPYLPTHLCQPIIQSQAFPPYIYAHLYPLVGMNHDLAFLQLSILNKYMFFPAATTKEHTAYNCYGININISG